MRLSHSERLILKQMVSDRLRDELKVQKTEPPEPKVSQSSGARWLRNKRAHYKEHGYKPCTTPEWVIESARKLQMGRCRICGKQGKLVKDHNHETGEFRAFLCGRCNSGLGFFLDSPDLLMAAAAYLSYDSLQ